MSKLIVGLTGMSGSGKSTVSRIFAENEIDVINCDKCAREVTVSGSPALAEISEKLGANYVLQDGNLDRRAVSELIFHDSEKRLIFNQIIYPYITYNIAVRIKSSSAQIVLLDAPTLFEARLDFLCDKIVCVIADVNACVERIMRRDNISQELAAARLSSQHDAKFFCENSDYCIENNDTSEKLANTAKKISELLKGEL